VRAVAAARGAGLKAPAIPVDTRGVKLSLLVAALALVVPPVPSDSARATTLVELRANPGKRLGEEVEFTLQFRALSESWNPYLSRFEPGRWLGLSAWPDEVFLWDEASFDRPATRLFARRGGELERALRAARPYQRFHVTALVREHFLGEAWLELTALKRLSEEVGEGTLLHVTRARELALEGSFDLALEQYERARRAPLPPHALAAILEEELETNEAREAREPNEGKQPSAKNGERRP
jgi:hypothetical protein